MRREGALGICGYLYEDNIKVDFKETIFEDVDWICFMAQNMVQWWVLVGMAKSL